MKKKRILLVDDDDMLREMLQHALTQLGYAAITASNGREALELVEATAPDLVLTDLVMPEREGIETIMELRRRYPHLQIIAMSGGGQRSAVAPAFLKLAKKLGAARTLSKPFSIGELQLALTELLPETE